MAILHVTLGTRDPARSARFFEQTFGWAPIDRPSNAPLPTCWLRIGENQELHLVHVPDFEVSPHEQEFGRHIAVSHPLGEFGRLKERLVAHGAELIAPRRETPFERFFFRDPNGYVFEVIGFEVIGAPGSQGSK
jgi:catechol 2,3-dioxygenase-like lactoylglutathione lyase family enzyme